MRTALLALLVAACGSGCVESKSCTEIGCGDQSSIAIHSADWMTPPMAVELDIDGRRVICGAPPLRTAGQAACDDRQVRVEHRERYDCKETRTATAATQSCTPNGRLEQVITVAGTPRRITVTLMADNAVVGQRTFESDYMTFRPNGEGCDPECRQRSDSWELPGDANALDAGVGDAPRSR